MRLATTASALVLAVGGIGHAMVTGLESGIERVDVFRGLSDRPKTSDGTNLLLVGTDGRDRITPQEKERFKLGGAPCHCTDTIMLVHLSADHGRASVVSLPRDSYAEIPAYTDPVTHKRRPAHRQKINAAYAEGGPRLTVRTVEHMTGVHIDHYLEVDFISFMKTVDVLGGVPVCTARPLKDAYTGLDLPAGSKVLGGGEALQYVRARHLDGGSDLARMVRQQRFLAALLHKATDSGVLLNPVRFNEVASTLLGAVRADQGFGTGDLVALGRALHGFTLASSEFASVPVSDAGHLVPKIGSTVTWDRKRADRLFRALREDRPLAEHADRRPSPGVRPAPPTPVAVAPGKVQVEVLNGTRTAGLAARADRALRATGFATTGTPHDAPDTGVAHTLITYDPRWDGSARALAAALPGAELREAPGQGPVLRVTVGADYREVRRVRADDGAPTKGGYGAVRGDEVACP
ncbi:LCP family protein [Streptomyces sp. LX-29]|nr:LCP family protein [Streptomyces sp. LX-29]WFB11755.1 LCP family protein [Streptomyces sp. LX-29]